MNYSLPSMLFFSFLFLIPSAYWLSTNRHRWHRLTVQYQVSSISRYWQRRSYTCYFSLRVFLSILSLSLPLSFFFSGRIKQAVDSMFIKETRAASLNKYIRHITNFGRPLAQHTASWSAATYKSKNLKRRSGNWEVAAEWFNPHTKRKDRMSTSE